MASFNVGPQKSEDERFDDAFKYMDQLFPHFPPISDFAVDDIIDKVYGDREARREMRDCQEELKATLKELGYVKMGSFNTQFKLTELGKAVKAAGGHAAYQVYKQNAQAQKAKEEALNYEKLALEVDSLRKQMSDYSSVRKQAKQSVTWSAISAIAAAVAVIVAIWTVLQNK